MQLSGNVYHYPRCHTSWSPVTGQFGTSVTLGLISRGLTSCEVLVSSQRDNWVMNGWRVVDGSKIFLCRWKLKRSLQSRQLNRASRISRTTTRTSVSAYSRLAVFFQSEHVYSSFQLGLLGERYATFALWHQPSVCLSVVCNDRCCVHPDGCTFRQYFINIKFTQYSVILHHLIAKGPGQFVIKFVEKIQRVLGDKLIY